MKLELKNKIDLIITKVEILKLKADIHNWSCYIPDDVKEQLEKVLLEIDELLNETR